MQRSQSKADRAFLIFLPGSLAAGHLLFCIYVASTPSEGWGWVLVTAIDFPISALLIALLHNLPPLVYFGIFGTLWWYSLGWLGAKLMIKVLATTSPTTVSGRGKRGTR